VTAHKCQHSGAKAVKSDDLSAIYFTCLDCGSKRINVTGEPKFSDTNIVTCTECGSFWLKSDFDAANNERIREMLKVGGKPN
jgi:transcription elongation factor Elf1